MKTLERRIDQLEREKPVESGPRAIERWVIEPDTGETWLYRRVTLRPERKIEYFAEGECPGPPVETFLTRQAKAAREISS